MGNCGTSAKTPFVLTPSGSCQLTVSIRRIYYTMLYYDMIWINAILYMIDHTI